MAPTEIEGVIRTARAQYLKSETFQDCGGNPENNRFVIYDQNRSAQLGHSQPPRWDLHDKLFPPSTKNPIQLAKRTGTVDTPYDFLVDRNGCTKLTIVFIEQLYRLSHRPH